MDVFYESELYFVRQISLSFQGLVESIILDLIGLYRLAKYTIFSLWYMQHWIMLDLRKKGVRYRLNVISHSVTLDLKMRDELKRGMWYKPEVRVSMREHGICWGQMRWSLSTDKVWDDNSGSRLNYYPWNHAYHANVWWDSSMAALVTLDSVLSCISLPWSSFKSFIYYLTPHWIELNWNTATQPKENIHPHKCVCWMWQGACNP